MASSLEKAELKKAARCPELKSVAAAAAVASASTAADAAAAADAGPFDCRLFEAAGEASPAGCFAGVLDLASSRPESDSLSPSV